MFVRIDDELKDHLEGGCAAVVGTRDDQLAPEITRAWGIRVLPDRRTIELCLGMPSSRRTLSNVNDNAQMAVTFADPLIYRGVQLKGRAVEILPPTAEDRQRVERHQEAFTQVVAQVGIPPAVCSRLWCHDDADAMVKISLVVEEAFDQTPGPDAGRSL